MDVDFDRLPVGHRRAVIAALSFIAVLALVLDWLIRWLGGIDSAEWVVSLSLIMQMIASGMLTTLAIYLCFRYFVPVGDGNALVELRPHEISRAFEREVAVANSWIFKGNFGRYFRSVVLPRLAHKKQAPLEVYMLDPRDGDLCERHADYRRQIPAIDKGREYTSDVVREELLVTLITCSFYRHARSLNLRVWLTRTFDPVRIDCAGDVLFITVEDRREQALQIRSSHFLFRFYMMHVSFARNQAVAFEMKRLANLTNIQGITESHVCEWLRESGLSDTCHTVSTRKIAAACRAQENPYAS